MNQTQTTAAKWDKVWSHLKESGCKDQLGTDQAEMAIDFINALLEQQQPEPQGGKICKCGEVFEPCGLCRGQHNHQQCVDDKMCHECTMKAKQEQPEPQGGLEEQPDGTVFFDEAGQIIPTDIIDKSGYCSIHHSYHCECYRPTKPEQDQHTNALKYWQGKYYSLTAKHEALVEGVKREAWDLKQTGELEPLADGFMKLIKGD